MPTVTDRKHALVPSLIFCLLLPAAARAAEIHVEVSGHGASFEVHAKAEIDVDIPNAWKVLTDYDRLAEFIPGMLESRVVSREGSKVIVDQRGETSLLFLTFPMKVRLEVDEQPFERIVSTAIAGNFKDLRGEYVLEPKASGMLLRYEGRFTPDFGYPPVLGTLIVRSTVERRFGAMVKEIEKTREIEKTKGGEPAPATR